MAFTYDTTTDIGKVRLLIHDQVNLPDHPAHYSDAEIQIFLDSGGSVKLAAAEALEAWAAYYSDSPDSEKIGDYCLPDTVEALSRNGWRRYNELDIGQEILAYDSKVDELKWTKILDIYQTQYNGRMLKLESGFKHITFSTLASPNHRWYVKPLYHTAKWRLRIHKSTELNSWDRIPLSASYNDGGIRSQWSDEFVECVGWFVTEGYFQKAKGRRYAAFISQSQTQNPENCQSIRYCLTRLLGDIPAEHKRNHHDISFYIGSRTKLYQQLCKVCPNKQLEMRFLNQLTSRQLRLLWQTMILGDGDKERTRFYQQDNETMQSFQALAVLCGFGTYLSQKDRDKTRNEAVFSLSCLTKIYRGIKALWKGWVDYSGGIWCPSTELGTWLARSNGFTFITGNSYSKKGQANMLSLADRYRKSEEEVPVLEWAEMDLVDGDYEE